MARGADLWRFSLLSVRSFSIPSPQPPPPPFARSPTPTVPPRRSSSPDRWILREKRLTRHYGHFRYSELKRVGSSSPPAKDLFYALRITSILGCQIDASTYDEVASRLHAVLKDANSLLEFYYSIGGLLSIKDQGHDVILSDADGTFHAIKALSQSDGRWRLDTNSAESSTFAAGIALESLAGVVSLVGSEVDQSMIGVVKNDIVKLFGSIKSFDDGTLYFDEKHVDGSEYKGPLTTSASVVRGVSAFAAAASGNLNIPGDKILGLAKFFLSIGVPGTTKDFFNQIDSLVSIPLILSLPATVLSLTSKDQLKVEVTTVFGSAAPPLTVNLVQAYSSDSKDELQFDAENVVHYLDIAALKLDVGSIPSFLRYLFFVTLHDPDNVNIYATGGQNSIRAFITGLIKVDKAEIGILESDAGSVESLQKLDLSKDNSVSLSANHLQKLRLSFVLTTPLGHTFKPIRTNCLQVFLKLRHETKVEHIFILESSARQYKIVLDFLGLVGKFYYLSGKYELELTVGDAAMENSFIQALGHIELDLPEPPEKAARPPPLAADPLSKFGPKQEISHIFRAPEKRPPKELSLAFLGLTLLPFFGFLFGLTKLGVNLKSFPSSPVPAAFSILFHAGIAAVLLLYVLFWLKLDLFTTLKILGFLGPFLVFVGHRTLSYLASTSTKQKAA
uniref:Dolichyl-diphosphooligosaccharide--protein glycosyltransferase subunit 2 n=1 Tax=Ananas comosus var. bracteatus TaxID=296719 RepID=A0A6V7PCE4_ANACO|nr:unnamed protein product [Ananas comosus var. bracteatus]